MPLHRITGTVLIGLTALSVRTSPKAPAQHRSPWQTILGRPIGDHLSSEDKGYLTFSLICLAQASADDCFPLAELLLLTE